MFCLYHILLCRQNTHLYWPGLALRRKEYFLDTRCKQQLTQFSLVSLVQEDDRKMQSKDKMIIMNMKITFNIPTCPIFKLAIVVLVVTIVVVISCCSF